MLKTALKPRWIAALILALAVSGVFVLLSQWQFSRSTQTDTPQPVVTESVKPLVSVMKPGEPMHSVGRGPADHRHRPFRPRQAGHCAGQAAGRHIRILGGDGLRRRRRARSQRRGHLPGDRYSGGARLAGRSRPGRSAAVGPATLEGRLIPSEAPDPKPNVPAGQVAALSTAQLINVWQVSSYPAFVIANNELANGTDVGAAAVAGPLKHITVTATDQGNQINWLNIFYAVEWVVFAGFAVFLWWRLVADDRAPPAGSPAWRPADDPDHDPGEYPAAMAPGYPHHPDIIQ